VKKSDFFIHLFGRVDKLNEFFSSLKITNNLCAKSHNFEALPSINFSTFAAINNYKNKTK